MIRQLRLLMISGLSLLGSVSSFGEGPVIGNAAGMPVSPQSMPSGLPPAAAALMGAQQRAQSVPGQLNQVVQQPSYQPPPNQSPQNQVSNFGASTTASVDAAIDDALKIRDPFQKPEKLRNKISAVEELENISVEQIRMIGAVTGPKQTSALVIGNGKSFFVTVNTRIGPRKGIVRLITAKGMIVREKIINVIGREESVDTKIFIEQDPTKKGG